MKSMIGWESNPWIFEVTRTSVRSFARGVGYTDWVYFDVDAAKSAGYKDLPAPPTYLGTDIFIPGKSNDNLPLPPGFDLNINHDLIGLLDGGTEIEYFMPVYAGDTLTCVKKLTKLEVKNSKNLGDFLIMTYELSFTNQHNKTSAKQTNRLIHY